MKNLVNRSVSRRDQDLLPEAAATIVLLTGLYDRQHVDQKFQCCCRVLTDQRSHVNKQMPASTGRWSLSGASCDLLPHTQGRVGSGDRLGMYPPQRLMQAIAQRDPHTPNCGSYCGSWSPASS